VPVYVNIISLFKASEWKTHPHIKFLTSHGGRFIYQLFDLVEICLAANEAVQFCSSNFQLPSMELVHIPSIIAGN
jgi:hypothetical protein